MPRLRFPGFGGEWKFVPFGSIIRETNLRTNIENEDILLSAAIEGMFLNSELFDHQRSASNKGYKKIKLRTLVLSTQNLHLGNANVNLRFEHGIVSPAYKTYEVVGCDPVLLGQWVKTGKAKKFFFDATTVGASVCRRNVEWDTLYQQQLCLPTENEQHKLADFLSLLTDRISSQQRLVELLKKHKRGLLREVFEEKIDGDCYSFSEIASRRNEKIAPTKDSCLDCIELEHIEPETGMLLGCVPLNGQNSLKNLCKPSDIVFGKLRPYLRKFVFAENECAVSSETWVLTAVDGIYPKFLFYLIQSEPFMRAASVSSGTKMPRSEWSNVANAKFYVPDRTQQEIIAACFSEIDSRILASQRILTAAQAYKRGLLQQIFV